MNITQFPHVILINNAKVKRKELSGGILHFISDFEKAYRGYSLKPTESGLQKLKEKSEVIAQHIYDYFVEDDEQIDDPTLSQMIQAVASNNDEPATAKELLDNITPPTATPPRTMEVFKAENKDEQILHELFSNNILTVTKDELSKKGFNTGIFGRLNSKGAIFATYRLTPTKLFSTTYNINK